MHLSNWSVEGRTYIVHVLCKHCKEDLLLRTNYNSSLLLVAFHYLCFVILIHHVEQVLT